MSWYRKTYPLAVALLVLVAGASLPPPVHAARLFVVDGDALNDPGELQFQPKCTAVLTGPIEVGDYALVSEALKDRTLAGDVGGYRALCLSSEGGDLREAIKLGTLFQSWIMAVENGESCISACAVLFMSGFPRDTVFGVDTSWGGRYLHVGATLSFHAPSLQVAEPVRGGEALDQAYARALSTIALLGFYDHFAVETHLERFAEPSPLWGDDQFTAAQEGPGASNGLLPIGLVGAILSTPPDKLYRIETVNQALAWGIGLTGVPAPPVISKRMLQVACTNVQRQRCPSDIGQGFPGQRCLSYLYKRHLRRPLDTNFDFANAERLSMFRNHADSLLPLQLEKPWSPAASAKGERLDRQPVAPSVSQAAALGEACEVRATWKDGHIAELEIDTFNSILRDGRPLLQQPKLDPIRQRKGRLVNKQFVQFDLAPWKMLPASARLADLGRDPWRIVAEGSDVFDRPTRLRRR